MLKKIILASFILASMGSAFALEPTHKESKNPTLSAQAQEARMQKEQQERENSMQKRQNENDQGRSTPKTINTQMKKDNK